MKLRHKERIWRPPHQTAMFPMHRQPRAFAKPRKRPATIIPATLTPPVRRPAVGIRAVLLVMALTPVPVLVKVRAKVPVAEILVHLLVLEEYVSPPAFMAP